MTAGNKNVAQNRTGNNNMAENQAIRKVEATCERWQEKRGRACDQLEALLLGEVHLQELIPTCSILSWATISPILATSPPDSFIPIMFGCEDNLKQILMR